MISIFKNKNIISTKNNEKGLEYKGLSTDEKPTENIANGTVFIEIDTGKLYMFDQENEEWKEI